MTPPGFNMLTAFCTAFLIADEGYDPMEESVNNSKMKSAEDCFNNNGAAVDDDDIVVAWDGNGNGNARLHTWDVTVAASLA
mmetsp:Transcript_43300/g.73864  ORF Transcript_43300/g.73864 Transcript_43300/m.73864 type:complete len:81 (-) Transcript_43300:185-427(-)